MELHGKSGPSHLCYHLATNHSRSICFSAKNFNATQRQHKHTIYCRRPRSLSELREPAVACAFSSRSSATCRRHLECPGILKNHKDAVPVEETAVLQKPPSSCNNCKTHQSGRQLFGNRTGRQVARASWFKTDLQVNLLLPRKSRLFHTTLTLFMKKSFTRAKYPTCAFGTMLDHQARDDNAG